MATEGQRRRRRRARQRRRTGNRGTVGRLNIFAGGSQNTRGRQLLASQQGQVYNPSQWYSETYEFIVNTLTGAGKTVFCASLNDVTGLRDRVTKAGEYRLLRLVCRYSPISADDKARIAIAPYFDPINKFTTAAQFVANGRRIRKADQNFQVSWDTPTEPQSVLDPANPIDIIGGVCVYYKGGPSTDFGIIACNVTYQFRGRKTEAGSIAAS